LNNQNLIGYKRLIAWQKADELARLIYKTTLTFPKEELFGITSQLRRAVLSVPLNVVEGYGRNNKKEFHRFLPIALGSLAETSYLLEFALQMDFIKEKEFNDYYSLKEEVGHLVWKLYISLE
jgi:four helix bundle protein